MAASRPSPAPDGDLLPLVAGNLRRLRSERALSLEALGKLSGVSRAMLGQIELLQSTPTVNVMWKIAQGLGVPFSALLDRHDPKAAAAEAKIVRASAARPIQSGTAAFTSRPLFPGDGARPVEFYELRVKPKREELAEPHAPGTTEMFIVSSGKLELEVDGKIHKLDTGDAIQFAADVPHRYRNPGRATAVLYMVIQYR